ncbi:MAG: LON peptidase substrate-binding domain-containing protein [Algisphaera sp.]
MDLQRITVNFNRPIPLFPLPACVLLPHATVPLHVFEERYRAMVRHALDASGLIAMAVYDTQAHDGHSLRPIVCMGYLIQHERLDDGRYHILLHGICRATLVEEQDVHPDGYRMAMLSPFAVDEIVPDDESQALTNVRERIRELLKDPALSKLGPVTEVDGWLEDRLPTAALIDLVTLAVSPDPESRYACLAEEDPRRRGESLTGILLGKKVE